MKTSLPDCRKRQGSRPEVEKRNRTSSVKIVLTPVVKAAAACEAKSWQMTDSSNLICNLRRCLETFQLSAQFLPTHASQTASVGCFSSSPAQIDWLEVHVKLIALHPNCRPRITWGRCQWSGGARDSLPTVISERERWGVIKRLPARTRIASETIISQKPEY